VAHELVVLGAAFLLAAVLARLGARFGLPTIPLFMAAGIAMGPNTPGPVLFDHPEDLELLAAFGLIFLMFYLGVEFSFDDLVSGGRKLVYSAAIYLVLNFGVGLAFGFALFILVHLLMVVLAGPINEIRSMITGRFRLPSERAP